MGLEHQNADFPLTVRTLINLLSVAVCTWFLAATIVARARKGLGKGRRFILALITSLWMEGAIDSLCFFKAWRYGTPCWILGMASQYTTCLVVLWSLVVSYYLYDTVMTQRPSKVSEPRVFIATYVGAVIPAIAPWATDSYGFAGEWCWIAVDRPHGRLLQLCCFYIPLWVIIGAVCVLHFRLARRVFAVKKQDAMRTSHTDLTQAFLAPALSSLASPHPSGLSVVPGPSPSPAPLVGQRSGSMASSTSHGYSVTSSGRSVTTSGSGSGGLPRSWNRRSRKLKVKELMKYTVKKMAPFPIIFILCWVFPTIRRICQVATNTSPMWLIIAHAVSAPCQGVLTPLFYFRRPIRKRCRCIYAVLRDCLRGACRCCRAKPPRRRLTTSTTRSGSASAYASLERASVGSTARSVPTRDGLMEAGDKPGLGTGRGVDVDCDAALRSSAGLSLPDHTPDPSAEAGASWSSRGPGLSRGSSAMNPGV